MSIPLWHLNRVTGHEGTMPSKEVSMDIRQKLEACQSLVIGSGRCGS